MAGHSQEATSFFERTIGSMLNRAGEQFRELFCKVNMEHRSLLNRVKDDINGLKREREKLDAILGDLASLT